MTIIVTGAGGFVGRHLIDVLLRDGRHVVALDTRPGEFARATGLTRVEGDIADPEVLDRATAQGCDALVHLATVPGGAAEADPAASRRVNIDAMYDLLDRMKTVRPMARVVFASSIAVFGDPLPANVDDATPVAPRMLYGGHKAMMEVAVSMMSRRGDIDGVSIRLPGILARPQEPAGMKSAFMSDIFHALRAGRTFTCPVSADATIWAQSVMQCVDNIVHALSMDTASLPPTRAVTLPALRLTIGDLAGEIARQTGASSALVRYEPDPALQRAFGSQPLLQTPAANAAGFCHDGSLERLVERALRHMVVADASAARTR